MLKCQVVLQGRCVQVLKEIWILMLLWSRKGGNRILHKCLIIKNVCFASFTPHSYLSTLLESEKKKQFDVLGNTFSPFCWVLHRAKLAVPPLLMCFRLSSVNMLLAAASVSIQTSQWHQSTHLTLCESTITFMSHWLECRSNKTKQWHKILEKCLTTVFDQAVNTSPSSQ